MGGTTKPLRIGIDASNLQLSGTVLHLKKILEYAEPEKDSFDQMVVWGGQSLLDQLPEKDWLTKSNDALLNHGLVKRTWWQATRLSKLAREQCDVLFVPGGLFLGRFNPMVSMLQNLQVFDWKEISREGWSRKTLRLLILLVLQGWTFRKANGMIYLTDFCVDFMNEKHGWCSRAERKCVIPHGFPDEFKRPPREQNAISSYSNETPMKLTYLSRVSTYKHQWNVVEAVGMLREDGFPVELHLIGMADRGAGKKLEQSIAKWDPKGQYIWHHDQLPYEEVRSRLHETDLFVFASSCETFGIILLEAMGSGLPIVASDKRPMSDILADSGAYFDPLSPASIRDAIRSMVESPELRAELAERAFHRSELYSWQTCSRQTFEFIAEVANAEGSDS